MFEVLHGCTDPIKIMCAYADTLHYMYWRIVLISVFSAFLFTLDSSIVNIALPVMANYFGATVSDIAFVPTAYMITVSSTLLLVSMFFRRFGYRKVITAGYVIFITSTLVCSLSPSLRILILLRILQGLGGSVLLMGAFAVLPKYIEAEKLGLALGFTSSALGAGVAGGYPIGGFLTDYASWRFVFTFVGMLAVPVLVYAWKTLPEDEPQDRRLRFDMAGSSILFLLLSCFSYLLQYIEYFKTRRLTIYACLLGFMLLSWLFASIEKRIENPIVDISLFKSRQYAFAMLSRLFAAMLQYGNLFMMPFFLHIDKKISPAKSGIIIAAYSIFYVMLAPVSGLLSDRFSPEKVSLFSIGILTCASIAFPFVMHSSGISIIIAYLLIVSIGFSLFYPANNKFCILAVPENRHSMSVGIFLTVWVAGMSLGVSVFELVFTTSLLDYPAGLSALREVVESIPEKQISDAFYNVYLSGFYIILAALAFLLVSQTRMKKNDIRQGRL